MKMYNANGRLSVIAKSIFDTNMERLRAGESPMAIAESLHEQTKLIEYNGAFMEYGAPTIWYWSSFKKGQNWWSQLKPRPVRIIEDNRRFELYSYLSAYVPKPSGEPILVGTIMP